METNQCHRLLNSKAKFNRAAQPDWGRVASELDKQVTQVSTLPYASIAPRLQELDALR